MRPSQIAQPDTGGFDGNAGLAQLPGQQGTGNFNPEDYQPTNLTQPSDSSISTGRAYPYPVPGGTTPSLSWDRNNATYSGGSNDTSGLWNTLFPQSQPASPNFMQSLAHTILPRLPLFGPVYNVGNTMMHLAEGTAGSYGPATSLFGKILQTLFPNFRQTGSPIATAANAIGSAASAVGGAVTNAAKGSVQQQSSGGYTPSGADIFNANRPSFGITSQQVLFPGSPIGPTTGLNSNPYVPGNPNFNSAGLAKPGAWTTSIPGWAQANTRAIAAKNLI